MKQLAGILVALCFVLSPAKFSTAQEQQGHKPPKILTVTREFVKPGKGGPTHEKAESLYIHAMAQSKSPDHYIGMESMSGKNRALFFTGYDSFEGWEKQVKAQEKEEAFTAAIAHADAVDGELLEAIDRTVWYLDEEGSYNTSVDLPHVRYFELERFQVRPGHEREWTEGVKLVKAAYAKSIPDAHWAMYSAIYGIATPTYLIITPMKSTAEIDRTFADNPKFVAAMGEDGMKKLGELSAASIEFSETNLFSINPKMSNVGDDVAKADPEFWRPKPAAAKKAAEKSKP